MLTTLKNFRPVYEALVKDDASGLQPAFDIHAALAASKGITGRQSVHF